MNDNNPACVMKRFALIFCCLFSLLITGCSDKETERKLMGSWIGTVSDNSMGVSANLTYRLELKDSHKMKMTVSVSMIGIDNLMSASIKGSWRADPETIWLNIKDNLDININPGVELLANMLDVSTYDLKRELRDEFESELTGFAYMDIVSLKSDELVVDDDDIRIRFRRAGNSADNSQYESNNDYSQYESIDTEDRTGPGYTSIGSQPVTYDEIKLVGKVGGKYPIEMELDVADYSDITGRYRYTSSGSGAWLTLKGELYKEYISLKEYNEKGECCGSWDGQCFEAEGVGWTFSGTMTNYAGKTFHTELEQQ